MDQKKTTNTIRGVYGICRGASYMVKTVKGYYWYSETSVRMGAPICTSPSGKEYTYVSTESIGEGLAWADKFLVEVGPLTTEIWEGREHEEWQTL